MFVYAIDDADEQKRDHARRLIAEAAPGDLMLSTQVLSEFYVVTTRKLARPLAEEDAEEAVRQLAKLPTVETDAALVKSGIAISRDARLSFWDGLVVAAAARGGCDRLLSEDLSHGAMIASVAVENPFRMS